MRLVLEFDVGDGFTYCSRVTLPVEYESPEALLVYIEDCVLKRKPIDLKKTSLSCFDFLTDNTFYPPDIYTIDEWYSK